jgi:hypothetical protein
MFQVEVLSRPFRSQHEVVLVFCLVRVIGGLVLRRVVVLVDKDVIFLLSVQFMIVNSLLRDFDGGCTVDISIVIPRIEETFMFMIPRR